MRSTPRRACTGPKRALRFDTVSSGATADSTAGAVRTAAAGAGEGDAAASAQGAASGATMEPVIPSLCGLKGAFGHRRRLAMLIGNAATASTWDIMAGSASDLRTRKPMQAPATITTAAIPKQTW
jgi:hypothetical protein